MPTLIYAILTHWKTKKIPKTINNCLWGRNDHRCFGTRITVANYSFLWLTHKDTQDNDKC